MPNDGLDAKHTFLSHETALLTMTLSTCVRILNASCRVLPLETGIPLLPARATQQDG